MALTGILFRRDTKAALINNPPVDGEVVLATDTNEYGATLNGELIWREMFTGPAIYRKNTNADMQSILAVRTNDFCYVQEDNKIYNFYNNAWNVVSEIDDSQEASNLTWSSNKISSFKIDGNSRIVSLKNSTTASVIPLVTDLDDGELFVNVADGKIYFKKDTGSALSLIDMNNAININNSTNSELTSTNVNASLLELASTKAPKVNAILTTPNIGVATGTSFNGLTGLSSTTPTKILATASVGTSNTAARADHVHSSQDILSTITNPTFNSPVTLPYAILNTAIGTPPLIVTSNTKVTNLNVDLLDDQTGSYYTNVSNTDAGILSPIYGGTGTTGLTGIIYGNGTSAATSTTSSQLLSLATSSNTSTGTQKFVLSDSPVFTTQITTPRISNNVWCMNSFTSSSSSTSVVNVPFMTANLFAGGEILIMASESTNKHFTKLTFVYDGTNFFLSEDSTVYSNTVLASYNLQVINGVLNLVITPSSSIAKTYNIKTAMMFN